ncbi:hypothetical protein [uncultured Psychroserpens sp.]|uniref:hypothetical protein n=1 Tax=uncultured Psychroserpens sp. TaxID=255436 RepID=UPI00260B517F|nr:hypothetical protein [uncultured Psychroserpens sp.]
MNNKVILFIICIVTVSCGKNQELHFIDFVDIDAIENVEMSNNSGVFTLNKKQLIQFKKEIASLTYEPSYTVKVGAINMSLTINGKSYLMATATHGDYVEIDIGLVTKNAFKFENPFFKTNGINFDNYKKE